MSDVTFNRTAPSVSDNSRLRVIRLLAGVMLAPALALGGCRTSAETTGLPAPEPIADESPSQAQQLRTQLYGFADYFSASVAATADEIAAGTTDRQVQELTLRWKLRVIPTMQAVVLATDPREALLDAWVICAQMEHFLTEGEGADEFGTAQPLAVETAQRLTQRIERIAQSLLTTQQIEEVTRDIDEFVDGHQIHGRFAVGLIRASQEVAAGRSQGFGGLLSIRVGGVKETAEAIDRMARVAEVLAEVAESLPERARWQSELLLFEMEQLDTIVTATRDFNTLSTSIESISQTARELPAEIRGQLDALLEASDASQDKLQATIAEARAAIADVDGTLAGAGEVAATLETITLGLDEAAVSWGETAATVNTIVEIVSEMIEQRGPTEEVDFDIDDYTRAAEEIRATVVEARSLLEDLAASPASAGIDNAAARLDAVINRITICGLILIAATLIAFVAYRLFATRLARSLR